MFTLVELEDTVRLPPNEWEDEIESIKTQINKKFCNKIIDKVGLCIQLYDVLTIHRGFVYQGDGAQFIQVRFRLIVFCPKVGEVLEGFVARSTPTSIQISIGFFDQIYVPVTLMQEGTFYRKQDRVWVWNWEGNELPFSEKETIRFRVQDIFYTSPSHNMARKNVGTDDAQKPAPQPASLPKSTQESKVAEGESSNGALAQNQASRAKEFELPKFPMVILASVHEMGLGLSKWWTENGEALDKSTEINSSFSDRE